MSGFGPWADSISETERAARLRALRALALVFRAPELAQALAAAERDPALLQQALTALDRVPALPRRRLLATYNAVAVQGREAGATLP